MKNLLLPPPIFCKSNLASRHLCLFLFLTLLKLPLAMAARDFVAGPEPPNPCAPGAFDVTLPNGYHVSAAYPNGVQWGGIRIKIADGATVYFDRNVEMKSCAVQCGLNSKIVVDGAYFFRAGGSVFAACGSTWAGIQVNSAAWLEFELSELRDAVSAIEFKQGHAQWKTKIVGCTFTHNNVGIRVGTQSVGGVQFVPQIFTGNVFQWENPFDPNTDGAGIGIAFVNCPVGIISSSNTFRHLFRGISCSKSSNIFVSDCTFERMENVSPSISSTAILAAQSYLNVRRCNFSNDEYYGIYSTWAKNLTVQLCNFTGEEKYGIYSVFNLDPANIWIFSNSFNLNKTGELSAIYHERAPSSSTNSASNRISKNNITAPQSLFESSTLSMIDLKMPLGGSDHFQVWQNNLNSTQISTGQHGIFVHGDDQVLAHRLSIARCTLSFTGIFAPPNVVSNLGFALENTVGEGNRIDSNQVTSSLFPNAANEEWSSYIKCGIHNYQSPDLKICSNTTDYSYRGFHFSGNVNYCDFALNHVGHHWHGVDCQRLNEGTLNNMGEQNWHENVWTANTYVGFGANYRNAATALFKFKVDPAKPGNNPPSINISNWFVQEPTGESNSNCINGTQHPPKIADGDKALVFGEGNFTALVRWEGERLVLLKLMRYPTLMPPGSWERAYYDSRAGSSPFKFAEAQKRYADAFVFPSNLQTAINNLYADHRVKCDSIFLLDSIQRADESTFDLALWQATEALLNKVGSTGGSIDAQLSLIRAFSLNLLQEAETLATALPDTVLYEADAKGLLAKAIKYAKGDSLTEADYDVLRTIANHCPEQGGSAVRSAPNWLPHEEAVAYYPEDYGLGNCNGQRPSERATPLPALEGVRLMPNPANETLNVLLPEDMQQGIWEILDLAGRTAARGSVPSGKSFSLPLGDLSDGLYFLRLTDPAGRAASHKFAVSH